MEVHFAQRDYIAQMARTWNVMVQPDLALIHGDISWASTACGGQMDLL